MTVVCQSGDLFATELPAFAHGCNCAGAMGAGIAVEFRNRWPAMYAEYRRSCQTGMFQPGGVHVWQEFEPDGDRRRVIFNLMTQQAPGIRAQLPAIQQAVAAMTRWAEWHGLPAIGMPRIGAGLGGLSWPDVAEVVEKAAGPSQVQVTVFTPGEQEKEGSHGGHR